MTVIIHTSLAPVASWIYGMIGPVKTTKLAGILLSSGLIAGSLSSSIPLLVLFVGVICGKYRLHGCILHAVIPRKDLSRSSSPGIRV